MTGDCDYLLHRNTFKKLEDIMFVWYLYSYSVKFTNPNNICIRIRSRKLYSLTSGSIPIQYYETFICSISFVLQSVQCCESIVRIHQNFLMLRSVVAHLSNLFKLFCVSKKNLYWRISSIGEHRHRRNVTHPPTHLPTNLPNYLPTSTKSIENPTGLLGGGGLSSKGLLKGLCFMRLLSFTSFPFFKQGVPKRGLGSFGINSRFRTPSVPKVVWKCKCGQIIISTSKAPRRLWWPLFSW